MTPYRMDSSALVLRLPAAHTQIIHQNPAYIFVEESQSEKKKEKLQSVVGFEPACTVKLLQEKKRKSHQWGSNPHSYLKKKEKKPLLGFEPAPGIGFCICICF